MHLVQWDFSSGALHRPKPSTLQHRLSLSSTISLSLRRRNETSVLNLPMGPGSPDANTLNFHPAPSKNEVAVLQPILVSPVKIHKVWHTQTNVMLRSPQLKAIWKPQYCSSRTRFSLEHALGSSRYGHDLRIITITTMERKAQRPVMENNIGSALARRDCGRIDTCTVWWDYAMVVFIYADEWNTCCIRALRCEMP